MEKLKPLLTRWGRQYAGEAAGGLCPLNEYPRPQLKRDNWLCLNGLWQYVIRDAGCDGTAGIEPDRYDGEILVPFSPESLLSGVGRQLLPGQTLWYRRSIRLKAAEPGKRLLLHFGAVDQRCEVYINGKNAGRHEGGYWPFSFDITDLVHEGDNVISLAVTDDSDAGVEAYGKQKLKRGGIWYTAQSGIWQTVWAETVPEQYIKSVIITPCCEDSSVAISLYFSLPVPPSVHARVFGGNTLVSESGFNPVQDGEACTFRLPVPNFRCWSPDDPFLYTLKISSGSDEIESYFGMRQFGIVTGKDGLPRLALNGKAIFHSGLLDQGYWSDGLYTAPSDEAVIWELREVKRMGFNMLRKHIKIEPLRWYYHCDRLGILVWQDFVSGGGPYGRFISQYLPFIGVHIQDGGKNRGFGRSGKNGKNSRAVFERDMERTVNLLRNVVGLSVWTPFNEGWGQFDARRIADRLRALDDTRLIDHASGWHDQRCGDFASRHVYFKPFHPRKDPLNRIQALTEFGGYSLPCAGHMASEKLFGYRMYGNKELYTAALQRLYRTEVIPARERGLSAAIYTQLSDVEDEINGLFTCDRAELKINAETLLSINRELLQFSEA